MPSACKYEFGVSANHHMNQFVKAGPYPSTMYVQVVIPHHSSLTRKQILFGEPGSHTQVLLELLNMQ